MKEKMKIILVTVALGMGLSVLTACSPEVGSKEWCEDMKEKPKGEWSANDTSEYAKNCVF